LTRRSNELASGVIDALFHLVGVTLIQRETQNKTSWKAEEKASNAGNSFGFVAYESIGSPASINVTKASKK
jgi:hypothetical protein